MSKPAITPIPDPIVPINAGNHIWKIGGEVISAKQSIQELGEALLQHSDADDNTLRRVLASQELMIELDIRLSEATPTTTAAQRHKP